jgi:5-methylcytosine-specific restriction endonuclease McrA
MASVAWTQRRLEQQRVRRALYPLSEEQKEKARARAKRWAEANPERVRSNVQNWRKLNPARRQEEHKRDWKKNREKRLASGKRWRSNNLAYYRDRAQRDYQLHPAKWKARNHARRAQIREGGSFTEQEWLDKLAKLGMQCYYCSKPLDEKTLVIEHMTPLSRGGKNVIDNIVPACRPCNASKGKKTAQEFQRVLARPGKGV